MITGTYNLAVNPDWRNVQLQEVFLECDTTLAPVTINLFEIANLNGFWNVKLVVSDPNNNAGTNNITINTSGSDELDQQGNNQIVLNTNGESVALQVVSATQWLSVESIGGGGGTGSVNSYKMAKLPTSSLVSAENDISFSGEYIDLFGTFNNKQIIKLSNGNLAEVLYCQSILEDGTYIYEAYDAQTLDPESGYWIAYRPSPTNPNLLVKVAELKMTSQFWNNWYDYTVKDGADNEVKFITINTPFADAQTIEGWITTLTYSNGVLSAVDSKLNFGGATVLSLYNSLTGLGILGGNWAYCKPEYILDDDYYGMGVGSDYGWTYFRDNNATNPADQWTCVGFNVLTGQTQYVQAVPVLEAVTTNFDWASWGGTHKAFGSFYSHPSGLVFTLADAVALNNGDNVNNVSAVWSPYWADNTEVIYLNARDLTTGAFLFTGSSPLGFFFYPWYWDNNNFYTVVGNLFQTPQNLIVTRYNIATKAVTIFNLPNTAIDINGNGINTYANNESLLTFVNPFPNVLFGNKIYIVLSNTDPIILQTNNSYPTQMVGSKAISSYSSFDRNVYSVGSEVDEWDGVQF
jgi:hypothetical protein